MRSSGIEELTITLSPPDPALLPAVCLLPEPIAERTAATSKVRGVYQQLEASMLAFGRRFQRTYILTTRYGLVPVDQEYQPSEVRYEDMEHELRHRWLLHVERQLVLVTPPRWRVLALLASKTLQGIRRLALPFDTPLAGMSMYQRRQWLAAWNGLDNGELARIILGMGEPAICAVPPAPMPAPACGV